MVLLRKACMVACCLAVLLMTTQANREAKSVCNAKLKVTHNYQAVTPGVLVGNSNIHTRSLSPWTWRINFEEKRIPKTISEAVCSSNYCIDPNSRPDWAQHEVKLNSVPIAQNQLVLHFNKTLDCYKASFISVTVGCTCVRARME
ncbi:interleukin 17a/f2 [Anguilla rostrata]|uniref:interleukin 17a/f2 n=1 Tax=Anguilla rostrata TaxID=7938 RepID=UPI0030D326A3